MFDIRNELKKLPDKPGVYIMKDEEGQIIYIGKAIVLKNRVKQYFQSQTNMPQKVRSMVALIREFEYIVTDTEVEALILECNLIKKHRPRFNILLKDDKSFPYIKVTVNEDYPRVFMTRKILKDGSKYFGPYISVNAVKETLDLLKKLFPIKLCNKNLPRDIGKERPCLNYHIFQCIGPCQGSVDKASYREVIDDVCSFLNGKHTAIAKKLESQMKEAAENLEFEKAASFRNKLNGLKIIAEKQKVYSSAIKDVDVIAAVGNEADTCVQVFFVRGGKLLGRENFIFEGAGDIGTSKVVGSFIEQFYSTAEYVPRELIIKEEVEDLEVVEDWLSGKTGLKVRITVPRKGEKFKLLEMAEKNALLSLGQFKEKAGSSESTLYEALGGLKDILGLKEVPARIEAYDISNTGQTEIVASMVVFNGGQPSKGDYRRFKIKSVDRQNDYASMQEVIYRRFKHEEKESGEDAPKRKFAEKPDIILIDGGFGHINAVHEVLGSLGIDIKAAGMVKDDKHRTRGLVLKDGSEVVLSGNMPVLRLVTAIQDEAHRFAVDYNRKLRNKRYVKSVLDDVEGVGPKRKKALLRHFGDIRKIKAATVEELMKVDGINQSAASNIYSYFNQN